MRSVALSFAPAIALGVARFSYALLLPPMKAGLGWTYAEAGALNTANAVGYLSGALLYPLLARRFRPGGLVRAGCVVATLAMAAAGCTDAFALLMLLRGACGLGSALIFVGGGVLAARLATTHPAQSGLVLGVYYGGTGWGIIASALLVPGFLGAAAAPWHAAWFALAAACAVFGAGLWPVLRAVATTAEPVTVGIPVPAPRLVRMTPLLVAYALFGIGYIGYMTFIIALLRSAGLQAASITAFYVLLGLATTLSGKLWSAVLQRARGGGAFALFCGLLAAATFLPALAASPLAAVASGLLFGATFVAVVTSTTAFVRHNLPRPRWSLGISLFTIAFALGQIVGPVAMGLVSDGASLSLGFVVSGGVLVLGTVLALGQRPLASV